MGAWHRRPPGDHGRRESGGRASNQKTDFLAGKGTGKKLEEVHMAIVRWEPFRDLVSLQDRMNRLFDESYRSRSGGTAQEDDWALGGSWAPAVDIYEHDGNIVLKAELPGVDPKQVDIRVENNTLTLRGERTLDHEVKRDSYHRVERAYGQFTRSFTLPNTVDTEKIKADYKDGVLNLVLPKREEAKPKQIQVNVTRA
jgi:HSP20 family protein